MTGTPPAEGGAPPGAAGPAAGHDATGSELAEALLNRTRGLGGRRRRSATTKTGAAPRRSPGTGWSGPARDDRDPQLLDVAVERLVAEHGWEQDLAVHGVTARWELVVGPEVASHVRPERYADGELTVRADSTAWATQLRLLAPTVVRRLCEEIGDGIVRRVVVLGPQSPSWRKGPRSVRGRGPRDTYG